MKKAFLLLFALQSISSPVWAEKTCSYKTYSWNTVERKAVEFQFISHAYSSISEIEIDPTTGCTVCEEDQVEISIAPLPSFKVCHLLASDLKMVVEDLLSQGEPVFDVVGYRVGKTRGEIDDLGNRTGFQQSLFWCCL